MNRVAKRVDPVHRVNPPSHVRSAINDGAGTAKGKAMSIVTVEGIPPHVTSNVQTWKRRKSSRLVSIGVAVPAYQLGGVLQDAIVDTIAA